MIDVANSDAVYYYHFDGVGSVIALSDVNSLIVERYSYDVFGEPNRTSDVNNPYLFTGRRYDEETGLYYYRARYYDYYIGRFLQTDPVGYDDGLNLYIYVGNNPLEWVDPWGLKAGDRYISQDSAATAAMMEIYERSVTENVEYAGFVYKNWFFGTYSYTVARRGTKDSSHPGFSLRRVRAVYHSHAAYDPAYGAGNEFFSSPEKDSAITVECDLYLVTPTGIMKKYDRSTRNTTEMYKNVRLTLTQDKTTEHVMIPRKKPRDKK
jgi:RHS repeat-associated protein